jgi:Fe-S oxidoreductase
MTAGTHLDPVASTIDGCRYCWMCRQVCPVGHVTKRETLTPHGWALTIASVRRGTLGWNEETADVLYKCADCGMCRTHCVTDQPLPDAIAAARADIVRTGVAPPIVYALDEKLRRWGNPYAEREPEKGTARGEIALYVGDAAHHLGAGAVDAALLLLAAAGVKPVPVGVGRSSGLLASSLGLRATATALARVVIEEVQAAGCREVLVLAPGDRYTFEWLYRVRLDVGWPAGIAVKEVTAALAEAVEADRLSFRGRPDAPPYAYHDPCHGPRIGRDATAPRTLLKATLGETPARHLFWREHRAHPCGAVGGLEFTQPAISTQLAEARLADAAAAGAAWLITDDPACLHQLQTCATGDVHVLGLYELLADRLA